MKKRERTVMCFGDSNTWGCDPAGGPRFGRSVRWPGILQNELGDEYHVIEEGLGGRTTVWDDPLEGPKNGLEYLVPALCSHMPLDLLVIMLGTNDLKNRFGVSAMDVSWGIARLVETARNTSKAFVRGKPEILVICPPPFASMKTVDLRDIFIGGEEKSHRLAAEYKRQGKEKGFRVINAGDIIESSSLDGIHLAASEHQKLGIAVANEVQEILGS